MPLPVHVGTFLIFAGMVLLIVASISAPTVAKINFLEVRAANGWSIPLVYPCFINIQQARL
jgi:hypothetical protein